MEDGKKDRCYMKRKSIYTKAYFCELTFAQMPHKDLRNLYKSSISFFLNFNNRKRVEILESE